MTRNRFERDLETLNENLIKLGSIAEDSIEKSVLALVNQDKDLAIEVSSEKETEHLTDEIERYALKILLTQQPVAKDLRTISTALKIVTDMNRIGRQSRDICEIVLHLCEEEYRTKLIVIPKMAEKTKEMVNLSIDSFVRLDIDLAKNVIAMDDEVDALFAKVKENMIKLIHDNPAYADQALYLMMVGKYLEKIGDHAENIAQWVIFCKTGERKNVKLM